jgi:hypothetical protein
MPTATPPQLRASDIVFSAFSLTVIVLLRVVDVAGAIGAAVAGSGV